MKFKNETTENIKYRVGSYRSGFGWRTIRPGEIVELPWYTAEGTNLTKVEDEQAKEEAKGDPEDVAVFHEEPKEDTLADYRKKLIAIKGVGKKSAEDIIAKYPTEKELRKAIDDGDEIHNYDNVDKAVKKKFK